MLEIEQTGNGEMHAIGRSAVAIVGIESISGGPHRDIQSERVAGAAAIAIRRHHRDRAQGFDGEGQSREALCLIPVIVGKKNFHKV